MTVASRRPALGYFGAALGSTFQKGDRPLRQRGGGNATGDFGAVLVADPVVPRRQEPPGYI